MSHENLEVVRRSWDAWLRGDLPGVLREYDPEVVWDLTRFRESPESEFRGTENVERYFNEWFAVWEDYEVGVDEMLDAPDGRVVTLYWHRGTGRISGFAMHDEAALISTVRDGKITHIEVYDDRAKALEAVGLADGS